MFNYKLRIDTDNMEVVIVPIGKINEQRFQIYREISYPIEKDLNGKIKEVVFFEIEDCKFPSYLRCEDFPWERLKNLNEALNIRWLLMPTINPSPLIIGDPIYDETPNWFTSTVTYYTTSIKIIPTGKIDIIRNSSYEYPITFGDLTGGTCSCKCSNKYLNHEFGF